MAENTSNQSNANIMTKEFLIFAGVLMVRECSTEDAFDPRGGSVGRRVAAMMRPATKEEVAEYQEQQCLNRKTNQP